MTGKQFDDCFDGDKMLPHAEALARLREGIEPIADREMAPLGEATGRVLAEPVIAPRNIPAHTNSAVDGYAFRFEDYDAEHGLTLPLSGRMAAGAPLQGEARTGASVRIFTGAAMPEALDAVAMQEHCERLMIEGREHVRLPAGLQPDANVRRAGEDVRAGEPVLQATRRLRPQELAAIASTGAGAVSCFRRLELALFSTGDEIIRPGETFSPGKVYDSNAAMLRGLVGRSGVVCNDLGVLPDEIGVLRDRLAAAAQNHDVLLTSGGVSVGELDHVLTVLKELGAVHLWKIAIKPGRPMSFGRIGDCLFLGLPGNPVAAFLCYLLYVLPVLQARGGMRVETPVRYMLPAGFHMRKKPGRREFLRGILRHGEDGELRVAKYARDGSGLISSLTEADGFIELEEELTEVAEGDPVAFVPFSSFGI